MYLFSKRIPNLHLINLHKYTSVGLQILKRKYAQKIDCGLFSKMPLHICRKDGKSVEQDCAWYRSRDTILSAYETGILTTEVCISLGCISLSIIRTFTPRRMCSVFYLAKDYKDVCRCTFSVLCIIKVSSL